MTVGLITYTSDERFSVTHLKNSEVRRCHFCFCHCDRRRERKDADGRHGLGDANVEEQKKNEQMRMEWGNDALLALFFRLTTGVTFQFLLNLFLLVVVTKAINYKLKKEGIIIFYFVFVLFDFFLRYFFGPPKKKIAIFSFLCSCIFFH